MCEFNSSYGDFATPGAVQIHGQTAGDDILCGNKSCTRDNTGSTTECGDPSGGKQLSYDRFGCQMIDTKFTSWQTLSGDANSGKLSGSGWNAIGAALNPTNYDPNGALYLPSISLTAADIEAGSTTTYPICDSNHRWICESGSGGATPYVVVYQYEGNFTADTNNKNYQEETTPSDTPVPIFNVVCDSTGAGWAFPCSDQTNFSHITNYNVTANVFESLDSGQVSEPIIVGDWFSGDVPE